MGARHLGRSSSSSHNWLGAFQRWARKFLPTRSEKPSHFICWTFEFWPSIHMIVHRDRWGGPIPNCAPQLSEHELHISRSCHYIFPDRSGDMSWAAGFQTKTEARPRNVSFSRSVSLHEAMETRPRSSTGLWYVPRTRPGMMANGCVTHCQSVRVLNSPAQYGTAQRRHHTLFSASVVSSGRYAWLKKQGSR